jgi:hypothetical protein
MRARIRKIRDTRYLGTVIRWFMHWGKPASSQPAEGDPTENKIRDTRYLGTRDPHAHTPSEPASFEPGQGDLAEKHREPVSRPARNSPAG